MEEMKALELMVWTLGIFTMSALLMAFVYATASSLWTLMERKRRAKKDFLSKEDFLWMRTADAQAAKGATTNWLSAFGSSAKEGILRNKKGPGESEGEDTKGNTRILLPSSIDKGDQVVAVVKGTVAFVDDDGIWISLKPLRQASEGHLNFWRYYRLNAGDNDNFTKADLAYAPLVTVIRVTAPNGEVLMKRRPKRKKGGRGGGGKR